jgi:4a-hydroxytetrahydrobiopterin dehydratase
MPESVTTLSDSEISSRMGTVAGWSRRGQKLYRDFQLGSFIEAFAVITQAALLSERLGHHPEWWNSYGDLRVELTTRECGGISERDFRWAAELNKMVDHKTEQ